MVEGSRGSYYFSLVIPTHNRNRDLFLLLNTLLSQSYIDSIQVIVISNLFDEAAQKFIADLNRPNVIFGHVGSVGVNKARNRGIDLSQGEWIYFLDDDCLPKNDLFFEMAAMQVKAEPSYNVWGGLYSSSEAMSAVSKYYIFKASSWILQNSYDDGRLTDMLLGGNLLIRSSLFKNGLRFNEEIIFGSSETEMINRLRLLSSPFRLSTELNLIHNIDIKMFELLRKAYLQGFGSKLANISLNKKYRMPILVPEKYLKIESLFNKSFYLGYLDSAAVYSIKHLKLRILARLSFQLIKDFRHKSLDLLKEIYRIFLKS